MSIVVPAVLPTSEDDFDDTLARYLALPGVERIQIDVVDGRFASPPSWPYTAPEELENMVARKKMLPRLDRIAYEIDLMCIDPESAAEPWLALGATRLTFHTESTTDLPRLLAFARRRYGSEVVFGIALNVATDLALIEPSLDEVAFVQFMGITKIGRQGQPFDDRVLEKIRAFCNRHPDIPIQVDGGVSLENAKQLLALGVTSLVIGSGILKAADPVAAFAAFEELQSSYGV